MFDVEIKVFKTYYFFLNHIYQPRFVLLVMLNILWISKKSYLVEHFVQKKSGLYTI